MEQILQVFFNAAILEQGRPEKIFSRPDHARVGEFVARIASHQ